MTSINLADDQIFNIDVNNSTITYFEPYNIDFDEGDDVTLRWNIGYQPLYKSAFILNHNAHFDAVAPLDTNVNIFDMIYVPDKARN